MLRAKTTRRNTETKDRVLEEVAKEETTRLNAVVSVSLHKAVKVQAANEERSITDLLIEALNDYLSKNTKE
jgi:predicted HicB family RNase H-like nuclease